ncbi:hypothetical protein [Cylindrospermopsis raciborskii]
MSITGYTGTLPGVDNINVNSFFQ